MLQIKPWIFSYLIHTNSVCFLIGNLSFWNFPDFAKFIWIPIVIKKRLFFKLRPSFFFSLMSKGLSFLLKIHIFATFRQIFEGLFDFWALLRFIENTCWGREEIKKGYIYIYMKSCFYLMSYGLYTYAAEIPNGVLTYLLRFLESFDSFSMENNLSDKCNQHLSIFIITR